MRYVILRDDDTNALTPVECLERLYRPFLHRNLPVNLAVIPDVATNALTPDGKPEGFLFAKNGTHSATSVNATDDVIMHSALSSPSPPQKEERAGVRRLQGAGGNSFDVQRSMLDVGCSRVYGEAAFRLQGETVPIGENSELIKYLHENSAYHVVQHGCHHDCFEFDRQSPMEISSRLEHGLKLFADAGFARPVTFVAPHDKLSRTSYREVAKRFDVISSGWFELERLPMAWWPGYFVKKTRHTAHWRAGRTLLLSHPGCLLSAQRDFDSMLDNIRRAVSSQKVTVLVTHWWEYFPNGQPHENFIRVLHQTADYLASQKDIKVISFADLAKSSFDLN